MKTRGTLGVLLAAKANGHLPRVRPIIDAVISSGFWFDTGTRERVLELAGETD